MDPKKEFQAKCNKESVDLLPLEKEEDIKFMKETLDEFQRETGSEVASYILDNFEAMQTCFVKVFPHEYQRALIELEAEKQKLEKTTSNVSELTIANQHSETKKETKCKDVVN